MKTYTKTHTSKKALDNHVAKIKKRGGKYTVKGNTVSYSFTKTGAVNIFDNVKKTIAEYYEQFGKKKLKTAISNYKKERKEYAKWKENNNNESASKEQVNKSWEVIENLQNAWINCFTNIEYAIEDVYDIDDFEITMDKSKQSESVYFNVEYTPSNELGIEFRLANHEDKHRSSNRKQLDITDETIMSNNIIGKYIVDEYNL